ncbi:decapping nuclease DXO homolog isoform X3 [Eriocheir sinensis]|nr:decapping nuclease DXO homolog isoform X3 [Eriocheir sinensis]
MMPVLSQKYIPDGEFMQVDMDLNRGWHKVNSFTGTSADGFRHLLQWILKNQENVRAKDSSDRLAADFVCSRRMLKQIMQAPYTHAKHQNAAWNILAKEFKGTIYLTSLVPKEEKHKEKQGASSLMEIYGHKFEQYMTGGDPDDVMETDCQFRCVLQLHLNEMSLLFAPDIDAVDPTRHKEDFKDLNSFLRLKAKLESTTSFTDYNYRKYTLNNWWIENKLTGVPRLLVGKRNRDGVVHTLQMLQTDDMPALAEGKWEPSVCINVLDKFLNFVKRRVVAEPDVVHHFEKSAMAIHHYRDPNLEDILPNWYKQKLFSTQDEESDCSSGSS